VLLCATETFVFKGQYIFDLRFAYGNKIVMHLYRSAKIFETMRIATYIILHLCIFSLISCSRADIEKEKQRLLATYKQDRKAHILGDFNAVRDSRTDSFISVHDGTVYKFNPQQTKDSLQKFFKTAQYDNWDDLEQPIISIAKDGSMAWLIYKVYVRRLQQNNKGSITQEEFIFAGMNTYTKSDGRWVHTANVLTAVSH
jgi:hypothetical protein